MRLKPETRRSLVDVVRDRADTQAEERAYTFLDAGEEEGSRLTWAELDRRSRAIGAAIAGRAPSQSRVLLLFPPGLDFIPAFFDWEDNIGWLFPEYIADYNVSICPSTRNKIRPDVNLSDDPAYVDAQALYGRDFIRDREELNV